MQNISIGDVLFIFLILCVIHGIMAWVGRVRAAKRAKPTAESAETSAGSDR